MIFNFGSNTENGNSDVNPVLEIIIVSAIIIWIIFGGTSKTYFVCKNHVCQIEYQRKFFNTKKIVPVELNTIKTFKIRSSIQRSHKTILKKRYYVYAQTLDGHEYKFLDSSYKKIKAQSFADRLNKALQVKPANLNMQLNSEYYNYEELTKGQ